MLSVGKNSQNNLCLMDVKEAGEASAHMQVPMPRNAARVVQGPCIFAIAGERMLAARVSGRSVFVQILPQDLKLDIDQLTEAEAMKAARFRCDRRQVPRPKWTLKRRIGSGDSLAITKIDRRLPALVKRSCPHRQSRKRFILSTGSLPAIKPDHKLLHSKILTESAHRGNGMRLQSVPEDMISGSKGRTGPQTRRLLN